jgi:hypothetical protein
MHANTTCRQGTISTLMTMHWHCCMCTGLLQVYDDQDQVSSAMSDIDPFWNMRGSTTERDRSDPFRDRDQFWRK